jgi:23S rRNA pseudouridine1911/1915/1917 synthase
VPRAGIVHRLDKDTSGLLMVAKTLEAQTDLVRQLQSRQVIRRYLALAWGQVKSQTVHASIGRDPRDRLRMALITGSAGKPAVTHVQLLQTGAFGKAKVSLVAWNHWGMLCWGILFIRRKTLLMHLNWNFLGADRLCMLQS